MKDAIAILGAGHGAHAMAGDLASRGFAVNMFEMPRFQGGVRKLFETQTIEVSGILQGTFELNKVTSDIDEAISGVKYILVVTPAFAHQSYARLLKGKVRSDQVIVVYPGAFAPCSFARSSGTWSARSSPTSTTFPTTPA